MLIANHAEGLSQFRFIQETYHDLLIQMVPDPFVENVDKEKAESIIAEEINKLFGDEFRIRFEWLNELPPDKTGKMRCFVCKVK
jgi:hypothetical protein